MDIHYFHSSYLDFWNFILQGALALFAKKSLLRHQNLALYIEVAIVVNFYSVY